MKAASVMALAATPAAFAAGDLYAAKLLSMEGAPIMNLTAALASLPAFVGSGGALSADALPLCTGTLLVCCVWLAYARWLVNQGERRAGEEHGSARWATKVEKRMFADARNADGNIILTKNCALALGEGNGAAAALNKNVLVVGGPGSGKTRYYVKPNLMQMNASYFVTDPKGTLAGDMGWMFERAGYDVLAFNTMDFSRSNHYNPLAYVRDEPGILTFVRCLIDNTTGDKDHAGDPFWENAERLLYTALVAYLLRHCPEADRNLPGLLTLLSLAEAREEDESYKSPLDLLFDEVERGERFVRDGIDEVPFDAESRAFDNGAPPFKWVSAGKPADPGEDFALSNYRAFRVAAGKTMKSIIISCNVRLKPLSIREVRELLSYDEMGLDRLGDGARRTILIASMADTNTTFSFLFALLMWQAIDVLCAVALERHGGRLPVPVHFVLDEFANIGKLPDFEHTVSVVRSRNISCSIILQSLSQLKGPYGDDAQTIIDCCDTTLFLGGKSTETNKVISEAIGKQTIRTINSSDSRGSNSSVTRNYSTSERDLMQPSEVGRLPRTEAIVLITGAYPIRDAKYALSAHPRYRLVDPGHKGAEFAERFDVRDYWQRRKKEVV